MCLAAAALITFAAFSSSLSVRLTHTVTRILQERHVHIPHSSLQYLTKSLQNKILFAFTTKGIICRVVAGLMAIKGVQRGVQMPTTIPH